MLGRPTIIKTLRFWQTLVAATFIACATGNEVRDRSGGEPPTDGGTSDGPGLTPPTGNGVIHLDPDAQTDGGEFELVEGGAPNPGSVSINKGAVPADIGAKFAGATPVIDAA